MRAPARYPALLSLVVAGLAGLNPVPAGEQGRPGACTLEQMLALVREHSPASRAAGAIEEIGAAARIEARARPNPVFEGSLARGRARDGSGTGTESAFSLLQPIEPPPRRRSRLAAGEASALLAGADSRARETEVLRSARDAWFEAVIDREELQLLGEQEAAARAIADLIARRVDAGESAGVEGLRARVDLLRLQRLAGSARTRASLSRARVSSLAAGFLDSSCPLAGDGSVPEQADEGDSVLLARARENDPRLLLARSRLAGAAADLEYARSGSLPDLDLGIFHERELDKSSAGVAIGLVLPVWNRARGLIARRTAELELARGELAVAERELESELYIARSSLLLAASQASEYRTDLLPRAEETFSIARFSYEQGESSLTDLLDAGRIRVEIARESLEVTRAFRAAETALLSLTGELR